MQHFSTFTLQDLSFTVKKILSLIDYKIILFQGNLGAGKTTCIKEFCKQLGCKDVVTSPTYSLVNEYHYPKGKIFHFDLYRLKSLEEVYDIGIEDYIYSGELCLIEWPEIFKQEIKADYHEISIFNLKNDRNLTFI